MFNILHCHVCEFAPGPCRGVCVCVKNGADIRANAAAGICPVGKFDRPEVIPDRMPAAPQDPDVLAMKRAVSQRGWGGAVEALAQSIGMDRVAKAWETITGLPCGCEGRKQLLNKVGAWVKRKWDSISGQLTQ